MELNQFDYSLPEALIAHYPARRRSASRLLHVNRDIGRFHDLGFMELAACLQPGDLLVLNNTRVLPARLIAHKPTGGKVEILLERVIGHDQALVQCRSSKQLKGGQVLQLQDKVRLEIIERQGEFILLKAQRSHDITQLFEAYGEIPLPPYIDRPAEAIDRQRYQTIYARHQGAVAAPTAGLHFDHDLLQTLRSSGIGVAEITLHVGAGTFKPVRESLDQHRMHAERYTISQAACAAIEHCRDAGGRIIAVGTTTVRALESAAQNGTLRAASGDTTLFIKPGFKFRVVDALITNFHLPRSTLLMLVCAFAGQRRVMQAYRYACANKYRFYSYGDAMFLTRK